MDQSQRLEPLGHTRTRSGAKAVRPRSSTRGPLEEDGGPLGVAADLPSPPRSQRTIPVSQLSPAVRSPLPRSAAQSPAPGRVAGPKEFAYLLKPELYHPLTQVSVPPPFRTSNKQPTPDTPLEELLARGQYRAAAIAATQALTGTGGSPAPEPTDHARIFDLLYVRLACLTLIDATALATQEAKALEDLNSVFYLDPVTGQHLVPWELRVLNVRLQAMGFGDPRRAVMSYYDLARDARARLAEATTRHDNSSRELWKERLAELGIKVAGALVEMDDLPGAAQHLASLKDRANGKLGMAKALLWLHLGDVDAARQCVLHDGLGAKAIAALCDMADGEYGQALERWRALQGTTQDEMVGVNMAVCLLYVGQMQEGRVLLETLVDAGRASHTLLFNLTTMYELCTDRGRSLKLNLAEKVAALDESPSGWEKSNADFKL